MGRYSSKMGRGPSSPEALKLKVVKPKGAGSSQWWIEATGPLQDFAREYVCFSGYFGPYSPRLFAAAPELLEALELAVPYLHRLPHEAAHKIASAIAKARGAA